MAEATLMALGPALRTAALEAGEANMPTPLPIAVPTIIGTAMAFPTSLTYSPVIGKFDTASYILSANP